MRLSDYEKMDGAREVDGLNDYKKSDKNSTFFWEQKGGAKKTLPLQLRALNFYRVYQYNGCRVKRIWENG